MIQIDHRESHDIDIFLDDPQMLPYLNPETQEFALSQKPDGYMTDGAHALKLAYEAQAKSTSSAAILSWPRRS